jgi:hypothetical protein
MAKHWPGVALFLVSMVVLGAFGNLNVLPILLPFAAIAGFLAVGLANRHRSLSLPRKKR